ncbi:hypothetical protein B0H10DRAFT_2218942 [Mycena sp. CBHHK59/15]|nr:hypothetical protein B0H10DRAFT_2218942 [Mycena sp. CBHHK59/15]
MATPVGSGPAVEPGSDAPTAPESDASEPDAPKVILVMLATGKQGSAVVHALARANDPTPAFTILAQTRDPASAKSRALGALPNVRLLQGTADAPAALFAAAGVPVHGVFSVQQSVDNPGGVAGELVQANALADAAAQAGVRHFVYASVNFGGVEGDRTEVPHFESKRLAELHLRTAHPTLRVTLLRLVTFMDQLVLGAPSSTTTRLTKIMFLTQLKPAVRLQFIAVSDIGRVAARVFADPAHYVGKTVNLAGDARTPGELDAGWRAVFGKDKGMRPRMLGGGLLAWAVGFFDEVGFDVDILALRAEFPELKDWETFLRTEVQAAAS